MPITGSQLRADVYRPLDRAIETRAARDRNATPFDRLILAHAIADGLPLVTSDRQILANASIARWDQ